VAQVVQQAGRHRLGGFVVCFGQLGALQRMLQLAHGLHAVLAVATKEQQVFDLAQRK
jgi:hypothetical protein